MEYVTNYCDKCNKVTEQEVVDMQEGEDCWKIMKVKCLECNEEYNIKIYC